MNTFNKVVSAALTTTTAVWASGAMLFLPVASAQTTADLQAQIAALLAQITQLQAQLNSSSGSTASTACSFTRDLTIGSTGSDVMCLQQYLNTSGFQVAASGVGSPGSETEYFGTLTKNSLASFQAAKSITPSVGYFGPKTRSYLSSLAVAPSTPTTPTTPTTPVTGPVP